MPEQADQSQSRKILSSFLFTFYSLDFFLGPVFVCLSQAFCSEGSELILLIVLPGRNLDLNLLWNLVPDMPPLGQYQSLGLGHQVCGRGVRFGRGEKRRRKVGFWGGPVWQNWEELVGLTWLLSTPISPPVFPNSPVSIISSGTSRALHHQCTVMQNTVHNAMRLKTQWACAACVKKRRWKDEARLADENTEATSESKQQLSWATDRMLRNIQKSQKYL